MALIEHTLFGDIDKVAKAIELIKHYEPPEGYYLAFSGGKDSCVIKELAKMASPFA
jgi:phosphoadenosine phosphosulfate reductase